MLFSLVARRTRNILAAGFTLAGAFVAQAPLAFAQTDVAAFPNRPIRIIVPFAPGGGNDIFARLVGAKLGEITGQTPIIENRPAAGGRVAAEFVASQPADGYTLFVGASGVMSIAAAVYPNLAYHPTRSFHPLTMIADFPLILVVPPNSPMKSVADLVAQAKADPAKATFASTSPAFTLTTELLKLRSGMPGVALPVKSSAEMVQCVTQALCLLAIVDPPPAIPQVQGGQVRALAVTGSDRIEQLPDVPSMKEAGYPDVNTRLWSGVFAPAGIAPALAERLEMLLRRAIADGEVSSKLKGMAARPGANPSGEFRKMIDADIQQYQAVVKAANLTFQ